MNKMQLLQAMAGKSALPGNELAPDDRCKVRQECYDCIHRRNVPGNTHIQCVKPDADMVGNQHGIRNGWFMYPLLFDPTWKEKACVNFEPKNRVVSDSVSGAGKSE